MSRLYTFRVAEHLDPAWSAWLDDMIIVPEQDGTAVLTGILEDREALYILLSKFHHLGITLPSLTSSVLADGNSD